MDTFLFPSSYTLSNMELVTYYGYLLLQSRHIFDTFYVI